MFVKLTPEQEMLRSTIRAVAQKSGMSPGGGAVAETDPANAAELLAPIGLDGILQAPLDACWSGCVEVAIATMELARWIVPVPFVGSTVMAAPLVALLDGGRSDHTSVMIGGHLDEATLDVGATTAVAWDAAGAASAIGLQRTETPGATDSGFSLLEVSLESAVPTRATDLSRRSYRCDLHSASEVGRIDGSAAADFVTRWRALAATCVAADIVGLMEGGLALAQSYALSRRQFDRQIGSFQAVQHLLAEQYLALQAARIAMYYAAWSVQERTPREALQSARVAKAYASEAGLRTAEAVIQVHGGIGFTWEHAAHLFLRRAMYDRTALGDERLHYRHYLSDARQELAEADARG